MFCLFSGFVSEELRSFFFFDKEQIVACRYYSNLLMGLQSVFEWESPHF